VKATPRIEAKKSKPNVKKGPPFAKKLLCSSKTTKFKLGTKVQSFQGPVPTVSVSLSACVKDKSLNNTTCISKFNSQLLSNFDHSCSMKILELKRLKQTEPFLR